MKHRFLVSLFFSPIFLFAQERENSIKHIFYNDSILAIKRWIGTDKKIDSLKTYYKTGELDEAFYFSDGKFNGASYKFNKAGKKVTTWQFKNGKLLERTDHILEFNKKDKEKIKAAHQKLKELNAKLKANPKDLKSELARAHTRRLLGNYTLALSDFRKIEKRLLKISEVKKVEVPNKFLANIYDAEAGIYQYYEMENHATHYKYKALKSDPEDKRLIYNLGSYLYGIKSYRLAEFYLNKALEKRPDHEFSHRALAGLYTDFENYEKALHHVNLAFAQESNLIKYGSGGVERDIRTLRGFVYHKLGESEKGITDLKEALRLNKNNSFAYRNLGVVYYDLGNNKQACELLQKAKDLGYEKTHDRYDLQDYLDYACKSVESIEKNIQTIENKTVLEIEPIQTPKLVDKPYVYPNPTKGIINIKNLSFTTFDYQLFDYTGKLITQGNSNNNSINLSNLPTGVYILKILNKQLTETFRVVKD